jgi:hypothetical protein
MEQKTELLRWNEAMELLKSVENPITNQLMNRANLEVLKHFVQLKRFPAADFDMLFFIEVMRDFCSDHETLGKVLAGEDLRLFTDDDFQKGSTPHGTDSDHG